MARLRTIEDMVADVRKRANLENSDLVDDPEIAEYLCQELAELKSAIRRAEGQPHDRVVQPYAIVAGTSLYDLPIDYWELLGIEADIGGRRRRMEPYMENERALLSGAPLLSTMASPMYRIASRTQFEVLPSTQNFTLFFKYVPGAVRLELGKNPPDAYDGCNGYEVAAIYGAVATCKDKEETDPSFYEARKAAIMTLIKANAAQRDAGAPERVTDVTGGLDDLTPFGFR